MENIKLDFPVAISNTMREAFVVCQRRGYWANHRQVVPQYPSIHLHAGAAFARGLEIARRSFYEEGKSPMDAEREGYNAMLAAYGSFDVEHGLEESNKSFENLSRAFESYFMEYPMNHDMFRPVITSEGKAALEFSFTLPTNIMHPQTGDPILYAGKFDMLAERDGAYWVVDEKTTSQLGQTWGKQWDLNSQFTGYCAAAIHYGYPVQGAMIRGIGLLKTKISHAQVPIYRPQWQIDRWWNQLHRDLRMMVAVYQADLADGGHGNEFSQALGSACTSYGECAYKRLCEAQNPEEWVELYYKPSEYNPLKSAVEEM